MSDESPAPRTDDLLAGLRSPNTRTRREAAWLLSGHREAARSVLPALRTALHDRDARVRIEAARAVLRLDPDCGDVAAPLAELVKDPRAPWPVRVGAAEILADLGPAARQALPVLIDVGDDPAQEGTPLRAAALGALGAIGAATPSACAAVIRGLGDPRPSTAGAAQDAAVLLGWSGVVPLLGALGDPRAAVREGAARCLRRVGLQAPDTAAALGDALSDPSAAVRVEAGWALAALGSGHAAAAALRAATTSLDPALRARAVAGLGCAQDGLPTDRTAVREALYDPDALVRSAAHAVTRAWGESPAPTPTPPGPGRASAQTPKAAVTRLVGTTLGRASRAADMAVLSFLGLEGTLALHLQGPWRLAAHDGLVVARADVAGDLEAAEAGGDLDEPERDEEFTPTRYDRRVRTWLDVLPPGDRVVVAAALEGPGDLRVTLSAGAVLTTFLDSVARADEAWRLFEAGDPSPHLVAKGSGLAFE